MVHTSGRPPERFENIVMNLLDSLAKLGGIWRLGVEWSEEPGLWIALLGYDFRVTPSVSTKMSASFSPIFDLSYLAVSPNYFMFDPDPNCFAAIPYTTVILNDYMDPITLDKAYIGEFEVAAYSERCDKVDIDSIAKFRVTDDFTQSDITMRSYAALSYFLYSKVIGSTRAAELNRWKISTIAALEYILYAEDRLAHEPRMARITMDVAEIWDRYFMEEKPHGITLAAEPSIEKKRSIVEGSAPRPEIAAGLYSGAEQGRPRITDMDLMSFCTMHLGLPYDVCSDIALDAAYMVQSIYQAYGVRLEVEEVWGQAQTVITIKRGLRAWEYQLASDIMTRFGQYFTSPEEALKWWRVSPTRSESSAWSYWVSSQARRAGRIAHPESAHCIVWEHKI